MKFSGGYPCIAQSWDKPKLDIRAPHLLIFVQSSLSPYISNKNTAQKPLIPPDMSPPSVEIFVLIDWAGIFQMFHCLLVVRN
jgi:hypothetical protein